MSLFEEYWVGKGLDLDSLWQEFDAGSGYIDKVSQTENYLLRLRFSGHPVNLPLFDHEVLYKTVKGTFHDVKKECLSKIEYEKAAPIFLYRIERSSGIFEFLAQFDPLLTYVAALGSAMLFYRKLFKMDQEADEKNWRFIKQNFPRATKEDLSSYMKAWTTWGRRKVLHRLIEQGLYEIEVSKEPFDGKTSPENIETVRITECLKDK